MKPFSDFLRRLFPLPQVGTLEAFLARILLAGLVWYSLEDGVDFSSQPHPAGLAAFFDLTWLSDPGMQTAWRVGAGVALAFYAAGIALPIALPTVTLAHILPFTLMNSQGFTHHGHQVISLLLLWQTLTVWVHAVRFGSWWLPPPALLRAWTLVQSQVILTGVYLVSVLSKLDASNGKWIMNSAYIPMDMVKTQRQNYLNKLDPQFAGDPPMAAWLLDNPWIARAMFGGGFLLEAFAWLAIGTRWPALAVGLAIIGMHRSIHHLMGLSFDQNEKLCWIYLVNLPWIASLALIAAWRAVRHGRPT